jgi:hypothetical protein
VGQNWYQLIHFDELSCLQVSFSGPQGAKTFSAPLAHFDTVLTCYVINISQQVLMCGFSVTALVGVKKSQ